MSRIGKKIITAVPGVKVTVVDGEVSVEAQKGKLKFKIPGRISCEVKDGQVLIKSPSNSIEDKSLHGLTRSIIANMVIGTVKGHEKTLELVGVGYRAAKQGENLVLNVGYSHPVIIEKVAGIQIETKDNKIVISGADKAKVGETAA